jgi:hypothetical protein
MASEDAIISDAFTEGENAETDDQDDLEDVVVEELEILGTEQVPVQSETMKEGDLEENESSLTDIEITTPDGNSNDKNDEDRQELETNGEDSETDDLPDVVVDDQLVVETRKQVPLEREKAKEGDLPLEESSLTEIEITTADGKGTNEKNDEEREEANEPSPSEMASEDVEQTSQAVDTVIADPVVETPWSLEECLYGVCTTTTTPDDDSLVDDDWVHIREPGLWKTTPHTIDLTLLRKMASQVGIPDEGSHRAVAWRVLLGYLPPDNREWERTLQERRQEYKAFVKEWFSNSHDCFHGDELRWKHRKAPNRCHDADQEEETHVPEASEPGIEEDDNQLHSPVRDRLKKAGLDAGVLDSILKNFNSLQISKVSDAATEDVSNDVDFVDGVQLLDQIRKDVDRTFPDLKFFLDPERNLGKRRYAALERILFTWSKFNKGVNYVQGMNEIVGTIYYVLANDWNEEWAQEAEADTFWLFGILLGDMQDVFISHLDTSETGIYSRIKMMETLLRRHDAEIIEHFNDIGIESSFFAIRWWTTLLSREFLLPDTIRLWDSMFASTHKDNFLCYVCVTMVIMIREQLLKGDFSVCLRTLQSYPSIRMDELLTASRTLWLYERQITVACHRGGIGLQQALEAVKPPDAIIMAFGFRGGILPGSQWENKSPSRVEAIQKAREAAAASVRGAGSAVKGWLGRATKLASNLGDQVKLTRTVSAESTHSGEMVLDSFSADEEDDIYMQAIQSAESGKYSYTK